MSKTKSKTLRLFYKSYQSEEKKKQEDLYKESLSPQEKMEKILSGHLFPGLTPKEINEAERRCK